MNSVRDHGHGVRISIHLFTTMNSRFLFTRNLLPFKLYCVVLAWSYGPTVPWALQGIPLLRPSHGWDQSIRNDIVSGRWQQFSTFPSSPRCDRYMLEDRN